MDESLVEHVVTSTVRTAVLHELTGERQPTDALISSLSASQSGVYKALSELRDRRLVTETDDGRWTVTGSGQVVADAIAAVEETEATLDTDAEYWRTHDVSVVPPAFRRQLWALADCSVVRATPTDPTRVQQQILDIVTDADSVQILSEVRHERYAEAVDERTADVEPQLLFDEAMVDQSGTGRYGTTDAWSGSVAIRVGRVPFTLAVVDEYVLLSLPNRDGTYDTYAEVVADSDAAREWGQRLFEHYWSEATPLEAYLD